MHQPVCQVRRTRSMQRARQQGDDGRCRPGQPLLPQEGGESWVDDELGMPGMAGQVRALASGIEHEDPAAHSIVGTYYVCIVSTMC